MNEIIQKAEYTSVSETSDDAIESLASQVHDINLHNTGIHQFTSKIHTEVSQGKTKLTDETPLSPKDVFNEYVKLLQNEQEPEITQYGEEGKHRLKGKLLEFDDRCLYFVRKNEGHAKEPNSSKYKLEIIPRLYNRLSNSQLKELKFTPQKEEVEIRVDSNNPQRSGHDKTKKQPLKKAKSFGP